MAHTLIIKGSVEQAQLALEVRGIRWYKVIPHPKFEECIVRTHPDVEWSNLAQWFCENRPCDKVTGFPAGTLLWYGPCP